MRSYHRGSRWRFHGLQKEMQVATRIVRRWPLAALQLVSQLADALNAGKTVLIDFTANWCPNCKFLESTVLDTKDVYEASTRTRS